MQAMGLTCSLAGIVEVEEGEVNGQELCIASHSIARISFAKEPHVEQVSRWACGSDGSRPLPRPGLGRLQAPLSLCSHTLRGDPPAPAVCGWVSLTVTHPPLCWGPGLLLLSQHKVFAGFPVFLIG